MKIFAKIYELKFTKNFEKYEKNPKKACISWFCEVYLRSAFKNTAMKREVAASFYAGNFRGEVRTRCGRRETLTMTETSFFSERRHDTPGSVDRSFPIVW